MIDFDINSSERKRILDFVHVSLEEFYQHTNRLPVAPIVDEEEVKNYAKSLSFDTSNGMEKVLSMVTEGLQKYAVHTAHSGYYGLYNPRINYLSSIADYITAIFNPQLAAWSHAPFANEIERHLVESFGVKLGFDKSSCDGTFCTAGAESNLTAVQCALNHHFPNVFTKGVLSLPKRPLIYCSSESHHSIVKAARTTGLGSDSVRSIAVTDDLSINCNLLKEQIERDIADGYEPFLVVGTAGTTGSGAIDNLEMLADICDIYNMWMHTDAAFGGGAIASGKYAKILKGIERSNSIMLDLHKWFSVPMATSLFLTNDPAILFKTFNIKTSYMPVDGDQVARVDPYLHSIQWSRRFNGLRIFLPLAVFGWSGYDEVITYQIEMGNQLREMLIEDGWEIRNDTQLPVICFSHAQLAGDDDKVSKLVDDVIASGQAWVSTYPVHGALTIRACITNYKTTTEDLKNLINTLKSNLKN